MFTLAVEPTTRAASELLTNGGFEDIGMGAAPESWGGLTYYTDGTHVAPTGILLPGGQVEHGSVDLTATNSSWALMICGFGMAGTMLRRRRNAATA